MKTRTVFLSLLGFAVIGTACTKIESEAPLEEEIDFQVINIESGAIVNDIERVYYIDGQLVEDGAFKVGDEGLYLLTTLENDKDGEPVVAEYAFTSKEGYIAYGVKNGIKLKEELDFTTHMSEYAETSGVIKEYELTGKVPDWYTEYEAAYYNSLFGDRTNGTKSLAVTLHQDFHGGPTWPMTFTLPFMVAGWNDTVSKIYIVGLTGGCSIFYKTFYRKHMRTIVNVAGSTYLYGAQDNSMSSGIRIL